MAGSNNYKIIVSAEINTAEIQKQLNQFSKTAKIKVDSSGVKQATKDVGFLGVKWADATKKFLAWKIIGDAFSGVSRAITQMVTDVYDLDKSLVEFNKVTDLSEKQLSSFIEKAYTAGEAVAKTGTEMIQASTEFSKAGFDENQSLQLAKTATLFQNIADTEISAGEASSFLISQMKAYNIEASDSIRIINVVNEVANKFAVGSNDLQSALTKAGSALGVLGNSYEETVGIITAGAEIMTGQSSKVSRGMRTIGINLAKMATETGELKTATGKATIALKDENGEMKSTFRILSDLHPVWKTMNNEQKTSLAQTVAGKNQFEVLVNTLNNFDTALSATETALNSSGSAARENEKVMEGMQAKINLLRSSIENFARKTIDADFIKSLLDLGTTVTKLATTDIGQFIIKIGLFTGAVLTATAAINMFKKSKFFSEILSAMKPMSNFIKNIVLSAKSASAYAAYAGAAGISTSTFALSVRGLTSAMLANPLFWGVSAVAGIFAVVKVIDKFTISLQEQKQIVEDLTSKISGLKSEYDSLSTKSDLTSAESNRLDLLTAEISANETLLVQEKKKEYARSNRKDISPIEFKGNENRTRSSDVGKVVKGETTKVFEQVKAYEELNSTKAESIEQDNKQKATKAELMASFIEEAKNLQDTKDIIGNLTPEDEKLLLVLNALISAYNTQTKAVTENGITIGDVSN
ncbi:MAG: phage tail tape measure protein, partial [Christensenellaceae bacterium]